MTRQGLLALVLLSACANANPRGRPALKVDATHPQWLAELQDERLGTGTFRRLYDKGVPTQWPGFYVAAAHTLEAHEGTSVAVGLERGYGLCSWNLRTHPGGISAPELRELSYDAVVLFDAKGRPTYAGSNGYHGPPLAVVDANGDGKVEELVHYSEHFVGDYKPFVTILSIKGGEPSVVFALEFNADAEVTVQSRSDRMSGGEVVIADDRLEWRPRETVDLEAIRHGGWSFAPSASGYNDIVVFETVDGISRKVAHFPYSAEEGRWLYSDAPPGDELWSVPETVVFPLVRLDRGSSSAPPRSLAVSRGIGEAGVRVW